MKNVLLILILLTLLSCTFRQTDERTDSSSSIEIETTINKEPVMKKESEDNKVRLAKIVVDPSRLDEYKVFLKEEIEVSLRLEKGVIALYAVAEKENPNHITILEIYADEEAYQNHIKTPHFLKYKEGTLDMVQELELIETTPLLPESLKALTEGR